MTRSMSSTGWPIKDNSFEMEQIVCMYAATVVDPFLIEFKRSFSDITCERERVANTRSKISHASRAVGEADITTRASSSQEPSKAM